MIKIDTHTKKKAEVEVMIKIKRKTSTRMRAQEKMIKINCPSLVNIILFSL